MDLQLAVQRVSLGDYFGTDTPENTETVGARVQRARDRQRERLRPLGCETNAEVTGALLRDLLRPPVGATAALDRAMERQLLTARGYDRVLRVAWTIADLAGHGVPDADDVGQALAFRRQGVAA